ncbi:MAG: hypothetical protein ABSG68_23255 [Thermoguttaceae bacterium]|jgi:hypothetical protein
MSKRRTYTFTLILAGAAEITEEIADRLFGAGCDDALLGSRDGVTFLDFDRVGDSLEATIKSAIRDVQTAGLKVARVEPDDLVNAAEIARRLKRTRESVRQLVAGTRGPGGFPPPVSSVTGSSPLWRWAEVARWITEHRLVADRSDVLDAAETIAKLNAVLEMRRMASSLTEVQELWRAFQTGVAKSKTKTRKSRPASQPVVV